MSPSNDKLYNILTPILVAATFLVIILAYLCLHSGEPLEPLPDEPSVESHP